MTLYVCHVTDTMTYPVLSEMINPSAWGHLNPSSYCDVGMFFYRVFKF